MLEFNYYKGIQADIQLLVKDGYNYSIAKIIARRAVGKRPCIYNKKDKMSKWCLCMYKDGQLLHTYFYYNLTELKKTIPELFYLKLKTFDANVIKYDMFIESKYGALRIRKLRGKNCLKYYYQINNI
jgi:hypothetical protein